MKRIIPLIAILIFVIIATSCNKNYTCTCTVYQSGQTPQISSRPMGVMSEGDAQYNCNIMKAEFTARNLESDCHI